MMDDFDARTLANMSMALDRVCGTLENGEEHAVRAHVAAKIAECARAGACSLQDLEAAGHAAANRSGLRREAMRTE
ncbi:hypothetical protein [Rhodopseudomonas palustris]|uniref:hypothetical protein n=1 Tax=Rhodopseudomonas palustris TaxID=1076 RepID=UPI0020CFDC0E|nr:hypothetical protein [Rhodopseudomonas palustris]